MAQAAEAACTLEWLIGHELILAERYRRFFSVLVLEPEERPQAPGKVLGKGLRQCDVTFALPGGLLAVVLSETDGRGALAALDRYREQGHLGRKNRFGVASYPEDNGAPHEFLALAIQRLRQTDPNRAGPGSERGGGSWASPKAPGPPGLERVVALRNLNTGER